MTMSASTVIALALILFCLIIAPLWLILHYSARWRQSRGLNYNERERLERLWQATRDLTERTQEIEAILEGDHPHWRTNDDLHTK